MDNQTIARWLSNYATELYAAHSSFYRVRAYRWAAERVRSLERPLEDVLAKEGRAGLAVLPGIGEHLAFTIEGLIRTGEFKTWDQRPRHALLHVSRNDKRALPAISRHG
jgi:DNA polymerase/3'-5' exonuclease PolX